MKKFFVAVAAAGMMSFASSADAQTPTPEAAPVVATAPMVQSTAVVRTTSTRNVRSVRRGGLLSSMMELERRKNAWLRRTFLNRR